MTHPTALGEVPEILELGQLLCCEGMLSIPPGCSRPCQADKMWTMIPSAPLFSLPSFGIGIYSSTGYHSVYWQLTLTHLAAGLRKQYTCL